MGSSIISKHWCLPQVSTRTSWSSMLLMGRSEFSTTSSPVNGWLITQLVASKCPLMRNFGGELLWRPDQTFLQSNEHETKNEAACLPVSFSPLWRSAECQVWWWSWRESGRLWLSAAANQTNVSTMELRMWSTHHWTKQYPQYLSHRRLRYTLNESRVTHLTVHNELAALAQVFGQQRAFQVTAECVLRKRAKAHKLI